MTEKKWDVIGFGNPSMDLIIELETLPVTDENMQMKQYCFQGGGNVATATAVCGMLGLRSSIMGVIGDDLLSRSALADFAYNHVDTSHLLVDPGTRSDFCLCISERSVCGKNFVSLPGTHRQTEAQDLDRSFFNSTKILHIGQPSDAVLQACRWVREAGGKVSIDAAYYRPQIYENYKNLDIFIGSEYYYNALCRDKNFDPEDFRNAMEYVRSQGPEIVIFTFGPDGCRGLNQDGFLEIPAIPVPVVDSTGAGDVFHGAFLYAWLQGWNLEQCCRFSTGASAIKCTRLGGRAGIPDLGMLTEFLNTGVIDKEKLDLREFQYNHGFDGM